MDNSQTARNNPKIVLYNPKHLSTGQRTVRTSLSLLAVSTLVGRKYSTIIVSDNLYERPVEKVLEECQNAVCLGITAFTGYQITDGLKLAMLIREKYPRLPIIWGGWHPTLEPEGTIQSPYVDITVRGQGERAFDEVVDALIEGRELDSILGISYKRDGQVFHNPDRPLEDINNFPSMPYHLIDVRKVLFNNEYGERVINYISSYGCPWRCGFCAEQMVHKRKWSALNPHRMAEEIEKLVNDYGVATVAFDDSNFFVDKERVRRFCEELIKRRLGIRWGGVNGRVPQLLGFENEMWELLVKSGCASISVGAESGYQPALDFMQKDVHVEQTIALVEKCRDYDIKLVFSMFYGLPWDPDYEKTRRLTDIEIRHTIDLASKMISLNRRNKALLYLYTPYPGTPLYLRSLKLGLQPPQSLEGWGNWVLHKRNTPWITPQQERLAEMLDLYIFVLQDQDTYAVASARFRNRFIRFLFKGVFKVYRSIARFRWKFNFFALPMEYYLYRWGVRKLPIARY